MTDITFLTSYPPFYVILVAFFVYSPSQVTCLLDGPNKDTYCYAWYSVWYRKYENLLQFITSWLASLRKWYYSRLFIIIFSFSCSGCDLTLIRKRDTLNCYSLLLKLLLKTKTYKLVLGNWQLNLLLKRQIQKKLSTFCQLCLVQQINESLSCYLHVNFMLSNLTRKKIRPWDTAKNSQENIHHAATS